MKQFMGTVLFISFTGVGVLLALSSCRPEGAVESRRLADTGAPALHAVHNSQLRDIMQRLDQLTLERMPQELDEGGKGYYSLGRMQEIAAALAEAAEAIPQVTGQLELADGEKQTFDALAQKLQQQALKLKEDARSGELNRVRQSIDAMTTTCNACHSTFRLKSALN